jgi:hypothetical protein
VLYLRLIILSVRGGVRVDSDVLLVIDFVNLKIKSTQSFGGAYRSRMCVRVFIWVSAHTCMSICVCTVFLKKRTNYAIQYNTILYKLFFIITLYSLHSQVVVSDMLVIIHFIQIYLKIIIYFIIIYFITK